MRGQLIIEEFQSRCLEGNPLGDPAVRETPVYLPEGWIKSREYPLIVVLSGFTGGSLSHLNWSAWGETLPQRIERLILEKKIPPSVVLMPDAFTRLGGSQYLNSPATGDYEDYMTGELIQWMRKEFNAGIDADRTVLTGKSSGGYGAFVLAARHPDLFGWSLVHSGDCYFEYGYLPAFPIAARELKKYSSPLEMVAFYGNPQKKIHHEAIDITAMAACYSPNPDSPWGFDYPFDLDTGEIREDVWARWKTHDPAQMVRNPQILANLRSLSGLYIECGQQDEFHLQWGAKILSKRLTESGVPHEYREFEGGHFNLQWRYDESLSWWGENS
ncbi:esterase [bacterium]|nr:esterase [bacterium]